VLGELTRQDEANRGLDLTGRDGRFFRVRRELRRLGGDTLEDVVDKRVENGHGLVRDTRVGVDLLKDCEGAIRKLLGKRKEWGGRTFVDVGRISLFARALTLLLVLAGRGCRLLCGPGRRFKNWELKRQRHN
jgi:hypothetical protein